VAWKQIYGALHDVPRIFQIWAAKQVTEIAGVNANQAIRNLGKGIDPRCPSCSAGEDSPYETCSHVLLWGRGKGSSNELYNRSAEQLAAEDRNP
jgi:hypothetical protein